MKLQDVPFEMIKCGKKTIELRLYDEKRRLISVNDEIEFIRLSNKSSSFLCRVVALHRFSSFEELYNSLPLMKCGYTEKDIATASAHDMDIYYSAEKQAKYGVLGIELELYR